jgi:hypothetical protein
MTLLELRQGTTKYDKPDTWCAEQQIIRAQLRHLNRIPGLSKPALATALCVSIRALKHGDIAELQVRQKQIAATLKYGSDKSIGNACRELQAKADAEYDPAHPGKYGTLTFFYHADDVDRIPPKGNDWDRASDVYGALSRVLDLIMRRQSNEGVRDALRILLWFLAEAGTWARTYVEVSDKQLGLKDGAGAKARRVLRESGFTVTEGCGTTKTRYTIGTNSGGQSPEICSPHQNSRTGYKDPLHLELDEYEAADAGEIFTSTDEMVDHVVLEYSVPATREIRALCSDLINRNVDHKVFNQITKELDWEQPRPFQFGVGFVHVRLREMIRRTPAPLPPPTRETARERATQAFFRIYRGSVLSMSEDELDALRAWAVSYFVPQEVHATILYYGLDDERCLKWLTDAYVKRSGVDMTEWINRMIEIERSLET